jgi:hypothetical protein
MEKINLKYQSAIFLNAVDISPKPDTLTYFISKFADKELIPGTFQELGPSGVMERFYLKDSEGKWSIEFSSNRIDIVKANANIGKTEMGSIAEFNSEVSKCIDIIFYKFPKKANRLAFVTTHIIHEISQKEISSIFNKLFNPIPTYRENELSEWKSRMVSRINKEFNKRTELHNFITEINRLKGKLNINSKTENVERLQIKLDINTFQGNTDYRFEIEDIKAYYNSVVHWERALRDELNTIFG